MAGERCTPTASGAKSAIRQVGLAATVVTALLVSAVIVPAAAEPLGNEGARYRSRPDYDPIPTEGRVTLDQGRGAFFATLAHLLGRLYDGARTKLGLDAPDPVPDAAQPATRSLQALTLGTLSVERLSLNADPRGYLSRGIAADSAVSILGLHSRVGLQLGTESLHQSFSLNGDCSRVWLPNDISSSFSAVHGDDGIGAWSGYLRTSWGTACAEGRPGWRLTAGIRDVGTDTVGSLGLEYRPARFTPLAETGLSSLRAHMVGGAGQVGAQLKMWELNGQSVRLDAGFDWQVDGPSAVRLGTRMQF